LLGLPAFDEQLEGMFGDFLAGRARILSADEHAFIARLRGVPTLAPLFVE
jgi:hypothetical protein